MSLQRFHNILSPSSVCSNTVAVVALTTLLFLCMPPAVTMEMIDTYHLPEDVGGCFPVLQDGSPPGSPYYPDEADCNCYYACTRYKTAMRMCCPADLWWNQTAHKCLYHTDFPLRQQVICDQKRQRKGERTLDTRCSGSMVSTLDTSCSGSTFDIRAVYTHSGDALSV